MQSINHLHASSAIIEHILLLYYHSKTCEELLTPCLDSSMHRDNIKHSCITKSDAYWNCVLEEDRKIFPDLFL